MKNMKNLRMVPGIGIFLAALFQAMEMSAAAQTGKEAIPESDFCSSLENTGKMVHEPG